MLVGFAFRALIKCPECQTGIPIQRVSKVERCESCAAHVPVGKELVDDICDEGNFSWFVFGGKKDDGEYRIHRARAMPACEACARDIAPDELEAALATGRFACPCGTETQVRGSDPILKTVTDLRYIVGESPADAAKPVGKPMVMPCAQCTAPLTLDGLLRTVMCTYCNVSNILPESIWRQLHPARQRRQIFLVLDLSESEVARRTYSGEWFDDEKGEEAGANPSTPLAALRGHATYGDDSARRGVAANPSTPVDLLATLAADKELAVRREVATNPNASSELIAKLADDPELAAEVLGLPNLPPSIRRHLIVTGLPRVREAALARADSATKSEIAATEGLALDVLLVLAADPDPAVLCAAAGNPRLPAQRLAELAKHPNRVVMDAARKNPSYKKKWWQF